LKNQIEIKVGICIAYDWELIKFSLPIIYNQVDKICLSLDKNRSTWSGNKFDFNDNDFFSYVQSIDIQNKISFYQDDFCVDKQNPMKGEVYQRNQMAKQLGEGGWHIQIDVDEYFVDFENVIGFLRKRNDLLNGKPINICLPVYTLFKQIEGGYLLIKGENEWFTIASNNPHYEFGRRNGYFNYRLNSAILHQSWAREEVEIHQKVNNWGHKNDFDVNVFYENWKLLSADNYKTWLNFHPIQKEVWQSLIFINGNSIQELISESKVFLKDLFLMSNWQLFLSNSRVFSKLKSLLSK